jgi:RNA polymerase sigma-70 factor (ECF subfamily)
VAAQDSLPGETFLDGPASERERPDGRSEEIAALMVAYQAGDEMAFESLYGVLARPVGGYLRSLTRDAARAEDLLQETFYSVHRARHTWDPSRSAKAWIYAIAHNVFLMSARSAKRRGRHEEQAPDELPDVPVPPEVEALADRQAVRRALAELPGDRREAIVLHHLGGLSFQEVGSVQGVTTMAAKLRAHRGMVRLRELLDGHRRSS